MNLLIGLLLRNEMLKKLISLILISSTFGVLRADRDYGLASCGVDNGFFWDIVLDDSGHTAESEPSGRILYVRGMLAGFAHGFRGGATQDPRDFPNRTSLPAIVAAIDDFYKNQSANRLIPLDLALSDVMLQFRGDPQFRDERLWNKLLRSQIETAKSCGMPPAYLKRAGDNTASPE